MHKSALSIHTGRVTCLIAEKTQRKRGEPRYWCTAHNASATAKYGIKLFECEVAYLQQPDTPPLILQPDDYPGGIGLWGAVPPVYDTTNVPSERGIHVHARKVAGGGKEIDETYPEVLVLAPSGHEEGKKIRVTGKSAVSQYISRYFKRELMTNYCTHCGSQHLDNEQFALKPHRRHLCHQCLREFVDTERGISNPIVELQRICGDNPDNRKLKRARDTLEIRQRDLAGGIQIWASNKAVLWTSPKEELEGIHVHTYARPGEMPTNDETYGRVIIDGIELDETMLGCYMAQKSLAYLHNRLVALECPICSAPHFDKNKNAYTPHKHHNCEQCGTAFETPGDRKLVVSNPFVKAINELRQNHLAKG